MWRFHSYYKLIEVRSIVDCVMVLRGVFGRWARSENGRVRRRGGG